MKRKALGVLGLIVAAGIAFGAVAAAGPKLVAESAREAGAPTVVGYSGQVAVDGVPFDGTGHFKFAVVDAAGMTTSWSNDGSSSGGAEPDTAVELAVGQGQFDVLLGDTTLPHMTEPLGASVFGGLERYLRLWFSADGASYEQLSPDRRIASVPYALQAANTDTLGGRHLEELALPSGSMVLSASAADPGLIAAGFASTGAAIQPEAWSSRKPIPTARSGLAVVAVDGIIYAIGGFADGVGVVAIVEAYDPESDSWSTKAPMPTGRTYLAAAAVNGIIYAIGGTGDQGPMATVEAYNPASNSWSTKASMPTARESLAAATVDGDIYAIGGIGLEGSVATVEAYDPITNSWSTKTPLPTARYGLAAAVVDGILYAIGGDGGFILMTLDAYDPSTGVWSSKSPMLTARYYLAAATLDGALYALGGRNAGAPTDVVEAYDPVANAWEYKPELMSERVYPGAATVEGRIYVVGGTITRSTEAYTPQPLLYVYEKD